jgi:hypothetical protein
MKSIRRKSSQKRGKAKYFRPRFFAQAVGDAPKEVPAKKNHGVVNRAKSMSRHSCVLRAKEWAKAFSGIAVTSMSSSGLGEGAIGLSIRM